MWMSSDRGIQVHIKIYKIYLSVLCLQVLPMLKTLYNAPTSASHHIYMSLIILLILSEDELFNHQVHDVVSLKVCLCIF